MKIVVCPAVHVEHCVAHHQPSHVLGLLSPGADEIALPQTRARRLELRFNDIAEARTDLVVPEQSHLEELVRFSQSWEKAAPFLIYCFAAVSRSTAAAFIIACQHHPAVKEVDIATALRQASPSATPNPRMVALADELLERQGRMSAAIAGIGHGEDYVEARSFELMLGVCI